MDNTSNNATGQASPALWALASRACDGTLTRDEQARLDVLLQSEDVRRCFGHYMLMHGELLWRARGDVEHADEVMPTVAPIFEVSGTAWHDPAASFSQGMPFCYLIATLVVGFGLLLSSLVPVSTSLHVARQSAPATSSPPPNPSPRMQFVGRITGLVDCAWSDPNTAVPGPVAVPLGRRYALSSGLMEITYDSGAKIILQGPCTYEVESPAGGYLSVGKLTARVEKKGNDECRMMNDELRTAQNDIHHSSFNIQHLFAVRTPTAIVTDLGTEFGVDVDNEGATTSHVFRGLVRVQVAGASDGPDDAGQVLRENESARVENRTTEQGDKCVIVAAKPIEFVRAMPQWRIKTLDLVDVVAGGDGFLGRRNRGINPTTGQATDASPPSDDGYLSGDGEYHRVETRPYVDGVFVPNGAAGTVQLDSIGHAFTEFGPTANMTCGPIWAAGIVPVPPAHASISPKFSTSLDGVDYGSGGHGALFLHANSGITFDLDAIRRANPGYRLTQFRSAAGNTETSLQRAAVYADFWVLIDGQMRFRRRQMNAYSGVSSIVISLAAKDRFLTLAATDGGNGITWDWIVFGDPRLEMDSQTPH